MKKNLYPLLLVLSPLSAFAGDAAVVDASATETETGIYRFDVTLRHADSGWEHYADSWEVVTPSGEVLGKRTLYHPHVNEQPFTRSLSGVVVPDGVDHVGIRAHDKVHGYSMQLFRIDILN